MPPRCRHYADAIFAIILISRRRHYAIIDIIIIADDYWPPLHYDISHYYAITGLRHYAIILY